MAVWQWGPWLNRQVLQWESIALAATVLAAAAIIGLLRRLAVTRRTARSERERQEASLAVAGERTRIAREVHDIVAHSLAVMIAQADAARLTVGTDPDGAEQRMRAVADNGRRALADIRQALRVLRGDSGPDGATRSPMPRLDGLSDLVDAARAAGMSVRLDSLGVRPTGLTEAWQLAVHRVVQESLTNALKHAGPGVAVRVCLEWFGEHLQLTIADGGAEKVDAARRSPTAGRGAGLGLTGMRERVQAFGGTLVAGPEPATGWVVRVRMPYVSDAALRMVP